MSEDSESSGIWHRNPDMDLFYDKRSYWLNDRTQDNRVYNMFGDILYTIYPLRILEVGMSKGKTSKELMELFPNAELYGLDILTKHIESARKMCPKGDFRLGDGYKPQNYFPLEFFDAVFYMNNLSLAENQEDLGEIAKDILSITSNNGHIFIGEGAKEIEIVDFYKEVEIEQFCSVVVQKRKDGNYLIDNRIIGQGYIGWVKPMKKALNVINQTI